MRLSTADVEEIAAAVSRRILSDGLFDREARRLAAQGLREMAVQLDLFARKFEDGE